MWIRKPGHRGRNALIGLAAGAGVGLGIGLSTRAKTGQLHFLSNGSVTAIGWAVGAISGTILGVVIRTAGWREIYRR